MIRRISVLFLAVIIGLTNFTSIPDISFAADEVVKIDRLSVSVRDGGKDVGGKYTWVTDGKEDSKDHRFTFRINYAISGTYDYEAEKVQIKIPKNILRNREGNFADYYDMSVPEWNDPDLEDTTDFVYKEVKEKVDPEDPNSEEVEYILIYNKIPVPGGTNGFIEVSYLTTERTWEYLDMGKSDDFYANMYISQGSQEDGTYRDAHKESNRIPVYIDTTAKITNIDKQTPQKLYRSWQDSWGDTIKPDNPDDYFYLVWPIRTWITANQPYNFNIEDIFTAKNGFVVGYSLTNGNFKETYPVQYLKENYSNYSRYDYVLTAHPKADYTEEEWQVKNSVRGHVDPYDQVDDDTYANDNAIFRYKAPKWQEPTGHFMLYKKGYKYSGEVSYWGGANSEEIRNYKLDQFKEGEINELTDLRYRVLKVGYAYPWTRNSALQDPSAFGHNPVKYVVTDNELFIGKLQNKDNDVKLDWQDANIYRLDFNLELWDANFDEEELKFSTGPRVREFKDSEWVDFFVEVKNSDEYVKIARWNPQTKEYTSVNSSYVQEATDKSIKFNRNDITGFKAEHSNARYYTELNLYPYVTLHNTDKVMNFIGEDMKIYVKDFADSKVYDYQNNEIVQFNNKFGYDYSMGIQTDGHITKKVKNTRNNKVKKNYVISWESSAYESFHDEEAVFRATEQSSGTFYDLLPLGGEYVNESIKVYGYKDGTLSEYNNAYQGGTKFEIEDFDISIKENYKKSGRDLLTIKINEPAEYYTIVYNSVHTWNNIKDYGKDVVNDVAYETGNEKIGDGKVDGSNDIFGNLDPNAGNAKKFLYEDAQHHISLITNALLNLKKQIRAAEDEHYSYKTRTYPDSDYYYNIRFATDDETTATDLMVMDSLENYTTASGETSAWRGSLKGINVKEIELLGADPKIYYSSVPNLDLEKYKNRNNYPDTNSVLADKIDDNAVWVSEETFGDPANATAFLVDIRTKQGGGKFILDYDTGVSMTVAMHSPKEVGALDHYNAYNNIYLWDTVHSKDGDVLEDSLVHQDFTQITYVVTADIPIHKVSAKDNSVAIKGTKWELKGDSVYGNTMDQEGTTDANGNYTFKKIEAGTYTLRETYVNNDYFINPTTYTVIVGMDGSVQIGDGTEEVEGTTVVTNPLNTDNNKFILTNKVRVHGDVEFTKKSFAHNKTSQQLIQAIKNGEKSFTILDSEVKPIASWDGHPLMNEFFVVRQYEHEALLIPRQYYGLIRNYCNKYGLEKPQWSNSGQGVYYEDSDVKKFLENEISNLFPKPLQAILKPYEVKITNYYINNTIHSEYKVKTNGVFLLPEEGIDGYKWTQEGTYTGITVNNTGTPYSGRGVYYKNDPDVYGFGSKNRLGSSMFGIWVSLDEKPQVNIPNTTFKLTGISDYGTEYNEYVTSTSRGKVSFKDIEKGTYELIETKPNDDYINPNIKYTVTVDENGNVSIDGEDFIEKENGETYLQNEAWHNFSLRKTDAVNGGYLEGAEFKLVGTDEYGKEVDMHETSNSNGRVTFDPLASGTYILQEVKAPKNYEANPKKYVVEIDRLGNVKIDGLSQDEQGFFVFPNPRGQDGKIKIIKKWNDGKTGEDAENRELPEITISTKEPEAKKGIRVTKKWVGDTPEDRPDNIIVRLVKKIKKTVNPLWGEAYAVFDSVDRSLVFFRDESGKYTNEQIEGTKTYYTGVESTGTEDYSIIPWYSKKNNVTSVVFKDTVKPAQTALWFCYMTSLTSITGLEKLDTSNVTNMSKMFFYCENLTSLNLSHFDTSNVTNMSEMFKYCENLTTFDVSHFDTSNVTDMSYMFEGCKILISLDVSHFDTSNVTSMYSMFTGCSNLTTLDVSHFDTSNVTEIDWMFYNCRNLTATLNIMKMPSYDLMLNLAATQNGAQIILKYINPVTSTDVDTLVATKSTDSNVVNGGEGTFVPPDTTNVWNENNPSPSKSYESTENKVVEDSRKWVDNRNGTWSYDFNHTQEDGDEYYVYEEPVDGYISDALIDTMKEVINGVVEIVNATPEAYAVFDSADGSLTFFRDDPGKYTNNQVIGTKTYYTGIESTEPKYAGVPWMSKSIKSVTFQDSIKPVSTAYWFYQLVSITSISGLEKLDTSNVTNMNRMFYDCNSLTSLDLSHFDTSNVTNMDSMFEECESLTSLDLSHFDTSNITNMDSMFEECKNLTSIDLSNFDTSNVTNMNRMFWRCYRLTSLDLSHFDTSNVTDMGYMFSNCTNLTSLDISHFDTSNVTNMGMMFYYCNKLTSLNLSHFDTSNVAYMSWMFRECGALTSLDISHFDTSKVTNMSLMFDACRNLTTMLNVMNMPSDYKSMCDNAASASGAQIILKYIDPVTSANIDRLVATKRTSKSNVVNGGQGTFMPPDTSGVWNKNNPSPTKGGALVNNSQNTQNSTQNNGKASAPKLLNNTRGGESDEPKPADWGEAYAVFDSADGSLTFFRDEEGKYTNKQEEGTKIYYTGVESTKTLYTDIPWYNQIYNITSVLFKDYIKPLRTTCWFYYMIHLKSITGIEKLDTSNATNMSKMFHHCENLTILDASHFNTSKVTDMSNMFSYCSKLTALDVSHFDTSNVELIYQMFLYCSSLTSIDVSHFDTSNVTNVNGMFSHCSNLTSLDVNNFDTSNVADMGSMFNRCGNLTTLDVSNFDTSNVRWIDNMFNYCQNLTSLDLSNFDTSNVESMQYMFNNCRELTVLNLSHFDTSKVTNMEYIFNVCLCLETLALGNKSIFTANTPQRNWQQYGTLSGRIVYDGNEFIELTDYDGSKPGWYKVKGTTAPNEADMMDVYKTSDDISKWVKVDDETWEYTFDVFDDEAQYYAWESEIPYGYTTDTDRNNYQIINDGKGNYKQVTIMNHTYEKSEEFGNLKIEKEIKDFAAEDSDAKFAFDVQLKPLEKEGTEPKYSHTPNISDDGTQNDNYLDNANLNDVVTIPGAKKLHVKIIYGGESASYDWACVWQGSHPEYTAGDNYNSSLSDKLGGGSNQVWEQEISGDTVTFGFRSDSSGVGNGYGYYAIVTPIGINGDPKAIEGTKIFGNTVFKDGKATVYLKHDESITIPNLPVPYEYIVIERPNGDYPLDSSEGDTGTLEGGEFSKATFVNKKVPEQERLEDTNGFKLTKKIEGGLALFTDKFDFAVSLTGLVPNRTYTYGDGLTFIADNDGNAEISVQLGKDEIIEFTGLPIGSRYQITELTNEYTPSYTVKEASNRWNLVEKGQGSAQLGESLGTSNEIVDEGEDITITFTNTRESLVPTNITRTIIPLLLFLVVIVSVIYYYRRKIFKKYYN